MIEEIEVRNSNPAMRSRQYDGVTTDEAEFFYGTEYLIRSSIVYLPAATLTLVFSGSPLINDRTVFNTTGDKVDADMYAQHRHFFGRKLPIHHRLLYRVRMLIRLGGDCCNPPCGYG